MDEQTRQARDAILAKITTIAQGSNHSTVMLRNIAEAYSLVTGGPAATTRGEGDDEKADR